MYEKFSPPVDGQAGNWKAEMLPSIGILSVFYFSDILKMHDLPLYTQLMLYAVAGYVIVGVLRQVLSLVFLAVTLYHMTNDQRAQFLSKNKFSDCLTKLIEAKKA